MKGFTLIVMSLTIFASVQCGVVKNLVETAAGEMHKMAGVIEEIAKKSKMNAMQDQGLNVNTKSSQYEGDTEQTLYTNMKISDPVNTDKGNISSNENIPLQFNVDITVVVNYNKDEPNVNIKSETSETNSTEMVDIKNVSDIIIDNSTKLTSATVTDKEEYAVNSKVTFPGPISDHILTYQDNGVVIIETKSNITSIDEVIFPDSIRNKNDTVTSACPSGMIAVNGDCLPPKTNNNKTDKTSGNEYGAGRAAFVGGCFQGYARAIDGSCQLIIED